MRQYTLLKKNTNRQEFSLPAFNRGCEYPAAPFQLFAIGQNNILAAGIEVGKCEVSIMKKSLEINPDNEGGKAKLDSLNVLIGDKY